MEEDLRYPTGRLVYPERPLTAEERRAGIATIAATPERLRAAVAGLSEAQLDTPYRPGGWTVRQVVHHVPDSHMNAYIRFKLALTEDEPTIRPYAEGAWAEISEAKTGPLPFSLNLLDALHERWVRMLAALTPEQWLRTYRHPESGVHGLDGLLAVYSWHGPHHIAHVTSLRRRQGW
ncbi:MAG TPA: putative metal-dependent hydrolase [Thermoanaerobaculia bacterium]|nr:putative metal-dependent hydrolase [Thermoanaerobaculia bacterium]